MKFTIKNLLLLAGPLILVILIMLSIKFFPFAAAVLAVAFATSLFPLFLGWIFYKAFGDK